ncbi:MAG: alpha/beta hydrolase [Cytophagales bacterium]|nr:MAG: alpha/beta hydrolase [Cytophagales bacterium]TAF60890.1 MAG: alpha/beta hydrolase [Cytophagales bacterium]
MQYTVKKQGEFEYIDEGSGEVLIMLHGLFGALSNWTDVIEHFSPKYRVLIPMMPIYTMPLKQADLNGLTDFIESFIAFQNLKEFSLIGNSLGGHIGLIFTLRHPHSVKRLVLTGSSGLFEHGMGNSYPRRSSYEFVRERVAYTFYDSTIATKELVDEVFEVTNDNSSCLRMISIARSAQRHNMAKDIHVIKVPTLLVWGLNDTITPPVVAHEFNNLLSNSTLKFVDKCCHVPMMEHPKVFNKYFEDFLNNS